MRAEANLGARSRNLDTTFRFRLQKGEHPGRGLRRVVIMGTATVAPRLDRVTLARPASVAEICEGDAVIAEDGALGQVDRLLRSEDHAPVYLIVRVGRALRRRYPVIPVSLITDVDSRRRRVRLRGRRTTIARLPETLPLVL